jgi:hypothetical protein
MPRRSREPGTFIEETMPDFAEGRAVHILVVHEHRTIEILFIYMCELLFETHYRGQVEGFPTLILVRGYDEYRGQTLSR